MADAASRVVPVPAGCGFDESMSKALALKLTTSASVANRLVYSIERAASAGIAPLTIDQLSRASPSL